MVSEEQKKEVEKIVKDFLDKYSYSHVANNINDWLLESIKDEAFKAVGKSFKEHARAEFRTKLFEIHETMHTKLSEIIDVANLILQEMRKK